ncbi:MAG: LysR substrate-binding domain-containing protein [Saprospiraceae bacterium]
MNFQQLEYIIAVDTHRHFLRAAQNCFVTQATLSMMIQKLEEELGVKLFDRSKKPVKPTEVGIKIIAQARRILGEVAKVFELVQEEKGELIGDLKIGIIPTLAPYLLPLFLKDFIAAYPQVKLIINEHITTQIVQRLKDGQLDVGILASPLNDKSIREQVLFYETFYLFVNKQEKGFNKHYVLPEDIDINRLWLLDEGHCMRNQILNFCELKKQHEIEENLHYEAGSIETLKNLVDNNFGMTIIPELAALNLSKLQKKRLRFFKTPMPVREISMITHRQYVKHKLVAVLRESILKAIPMEINKEKEVRIIDL